MAASSNPEISATELELKRRGRRRLIGAITMGLLAIVFLPMIFDSEPRRAGQGLKTQDISVQVPPKEGQPALAVPSAAPVVVPSPPPATSPADSAAADIAKVASATDAVTGASSGVAPAAPATAKVPAKEPTKPVLKSEKPPKSDAAQQIDKSGFVVQLGVFSDAENARQVIAKMKEARLAVYTENIPIKTGNATRVRVGPFTTRDQADTALAQVKLAGADGKIVPLQSPGR